MDPGNTAACQLPVPGATLPFWRMELHELDSFRSSKELPKECDILVIGTGYAGVSTVYHLLQDENVSPESVMMLEAREVCSGATGRNGGHVKPDVYYNILKYTHKYGSEAAAAFARFEAANVLAVKHLVEKEEINCDFVLTRAIDVYLDAEHAYDTEVAYQELVRIGVADLGDVQLLKGPLAEQISGVKDARCCFTFTAAHLWPYKLVTQLLAKLVARGVRVHTHTPVTSLSDTPDPLTGRWVATTGRGTVSARRVVLATNGYTAAVAPQFHARIVPVRGVCSRIVARGRPAPPRMSGSCSLRFGRGVYDYLAPRPDGSVVAGGAKPRFWGDRKEWYGVCDDSRLIAPAEGYFHGLMQRHFAGWEEVYARAEQVWTGIMGWTTDFMPYVGEVPGKPGQFIIAGFSGHGMPLICLAAKEFAEMVKGSKRFEETELPSIFKPTDERLADGKNEILGI